MLGWRRHRMRLLSREDRRLVELRTGGAMVPSGSCVMAMTVRGGRPGGGLRLLCLRPGERGPVLAHEFDVPPAQARVEHLVAIPRDATGLFLTAAGEGSPAVARVTITELAPPVLMVLLSARWLGRQLRQPRRLAGKVANLARVLRREGIRGAAAGVVASQTTRQSAAPPPVALPPRRARVSIAEMKGTFDRRRQRDLEAFLRSGDPLEMPADRDPVASIVVVTFNRAELTLHCLRSIAAHAGVPAEVIVVDNASTDRTGELLDRLRGATVVRGTRNVGFVEGCNQGAARARGRHVLLLNSDAFLRPGSVGAAVATLESDPEVGVVGGPIVALDGRLQEAGCVVWPDGRAQGYGRGDDPDKPEYRFRRDVDFVSGAFLMARRELWAKLGGFDEAYAPAYYEDVDFCLRAREAGFRVVYEPTAPVDHYEYGSSAGPAAAAAMADRRRVFLSRHRGKLPDRPRTGTDGLLAARSAEPRERVLVMDDRVPLAVMGSGAPRMAAIVRGVVDLGREVTFYPGLPFGGTWEEVYAEVPAEVEVMLGWDRTALGRFLDQRRGHYGHVIVSRAHNMAILRDLLARDPGLLGGANVVYDAEAIGAMRTVRQLEGKGLGTDRARRLIENEVEVATAAHRVASVSEAEARAFREAGIEEVHLLPHAVDLRPTSRPFGERRHLFFVGRLSEDLSPNVDGLRWFLAEVWPRVRRELGREAPEVVVAGRTSPTVAALQAPGLLLLGAAPDLTPLYDGARLFVAPLRFSAGIPLKVLEAASFGTPVVATDLLTEQLGWTAGRELLSSPVGDAEAFARNCVALYRDEALWTAVRERALARVAATATMEPFKAALERLLAPR